jgi:predicted Holliday junction resolvase-like endonuclease
MTTSILTILLILASAVIMYMRMRQKSALVKIEFRNDKIDYLEKDNNNLTDANEFLKEATRVVEEKLSLKQKEYDIRENAWEQTKKSFLDKVAELKDLREIITRKDETIARYKAELDKLNNPSKKPPYHFDESKAFLNKT